MANPAGVEPTSQHASERIQVEAERMLDVQLLLENLLIREEETAKLILDRLYDVASVNWINRNVPYPSMNRFTRWVAKFTKPAFKWVALRWVKRNAPQLITDWLYTQVKFQPKQSLPALPEDSSRQLAVANKIARCETEISQLQSRIRLLSVLLVVVTCTLGGAIIWSLRFAKPNVDLAPLQSTWQRTGEPVPRLRPER
ncbi:MAG: hypothetical protein IGS50_24070 [Synechococcales cyanobacterium C42_A2020_086]|jgi:hypothetical protein|nr:hypothetical protein [Synechococcales cyanobacterium C42_A2020_086]